MEKNQCLSSKGSAKRMKVIIKNNSLLSQKHGYDQRLFLPPTGYTLPTTTTADRNPLSPKKETDNQTRSQRQGTASQELISSTLERTANLFQTK